MNFLRSLIGRMTAPARTYQENAWPSVVVLLRAPLFPTAAKVLSTAQASWGARSPVEALATAREGASHFFRSGGMILSVHFAAQQYSELAEDGDEVLTRPWKEHRAWMSVDMPNERCFDLSAKKTLASAYQLLLTYASNAWSEDCLGIYFPAEGETLPNRGGLAKCIQWGRRNGLDLAFLK